MPQTKTGAPLFESKTFSRAVQLFRKGDVLVRLELDPASPDGLPVSCGLLRACPQVQGVDRDRPKFDTAHGVSELVDRHQRLAVLRFRFLNSGSQIDACIAISNGLPA